MKNQIIKYRNPGTAAEVSIKKQTKNHTLVTHNCRERDHYNWARRIIHMIWHMLLEGAFIELLTLLWLSSHSVFKGEEDGSPL